MSNKRLAILGLVATIMVLLTILQAQLTQREQTINTFSGPLIQGLDSRAISKIVLGAGDDSATIARKGNQFVVVEKDHYPAMMEKINDLLTEVLEMKVERLHTEKADLHDDLEVTEDNARNVVKLLNKDDKMIVGVIIGKRDEQGQYYVRKLTGTEKESNKVYAAENVPWLQMNPMSYIDSKLFMVTREDIKRVSVTSNNDTYRLVRDENDNITIQKKIPEGKQLKGRDYEQVFSAVTDLEFNDVQAEAPNLNFDKSYICELNDSTVVTFLLAENDGNIYTRCSAEFTGSITEAELNDPTATEEQIQERDMKYKALLAARGFNKKHDGWVYTLVPHKARNLTKSFTDLLEDIPEEPKETKNESEAESQSAQNDSGAQD